METNLADSVKNTSVGSTADEILRKCVHCGFCLATCPTYQILGDELDGPRGRIYQIKRVLEGAPAQRAVQVHLDRCLTCRSCETTCPSGVRYGHLIDIGRAEIAKQVQRPLGERAQRWLLREGLTRPWLFGTAMKLARAFTWALPQALRAKVGKARPAGPIPTQTHARKVLLLNNCVQPSMAPSIDAATTRVLDTLGVQAIVAPGSGCCGAIRQHLDDEGGARSNMRRNIDAWWPFVESGQVQAIVINASGCGVMVKDYVHLLRDDPAYAAKARRIVEITQDISEFLAGVALPATAESQRVAFHSPCTLQHGLKIKGQVEALLRSLGAEKLRARKLEALQERAPEVILSANIGCISHLQGATEIPVRHWIEWLDERVESCHENEVDFNVMK
jgi:glycolate oxidase iron-sulfur subunit